MAVILTPTNLYRGQPASGGTTLYTAPSGAGLYAIVKHISLHNTDTVARNIKLHSIAAAGSASAANRFFDYTLDPQETISLDMSMVLALSEILNAIAATSATITVHASGIVAS